MDRMSWFFIATALCCLITAAESICCLDAMVIKYNVTGVPCDRVGGKDSGHDCIITICANGRAMKTSDSYCGKGPCNNSGCECEGGCHVGDWETTFLQKYERYNINIIDMDYTKLFWMSGVWNYIADIITNKFF